MYVLVTKRRRKPSRGVKGMDRIICDSAGSQRDCKLDFPISSVQDAPTSKVRIFRSHYISLCIYRPGERARHGRHIQQEMVGQSYIPESSELSNNEGCLSCLAAFNFRFLVALRCSSTILRIDGAVGKSSGIGR
jgi:hypothetical protein